jgi:hypothetical protein
MPRETDRDAACEAGAKNQHQKQKKETQESKKAKHRKHQILARECFLQKLQGKRV